MTHATSSRRAVGYRWAPAICLAAAALAVVLAVLLMQLIGSGSNRQSLAPPNLQLTSDRIVPPVFSINGLSAPSAAMESSSLLQGGGEDGSIWLATQTDQVPPDAVILLDTARVDSLADFVGVNVVSTTGDVLGIVQTGGVPLAAIRTSARELLIADEPFDPVGGHDGYRGSVGTLTAYDMDNRLREKWQLPILGRAGYNIHNSTLMTLTGDEQHVAYITQRWEDSAAC